MDGGTKPFTSWPGHEKRKKGDGQGEEKGKGEGETERVGSHKSLEGIT